MTTGSRDIHSRPISATTARFNWRTYGFEITRRSSGRLGSPVRSRRVYVHAPYAVAAAAGAGVSKDESSRPVAVPFGLSPFLGRQPAREEIADFFEVVGSALSTGAGMGLALNMAARMSRSPTMRGIVGALHDMVTHGDDLHVAMRRFPRIFTPMQLAMVEAAAATGLDKAGGLFVTISQRLRKDGKVWQKFIGALAYPISLIVLTLIGAVILDIWALPPMVELFRTLGGRLPPITRGFYEVAQFFRGNGRVLIPITVTGTVAGLTFIPRLLRTQWIQRLSTRMVLIGPIVQSLALMRALGTFILLKQSGARVRDQFTLAAAAAGNCVVGDFFDACYARIALGESVEEAFTAERHRLGDDGTRIAGKMEVGMAGADLTALINQMVEEFSDRAEVRLNVLPTAIRWPLLIICCALIGTVALAIVLPYPNLIADVAHQQTQTLK